MKTASGQPARGVLGPWGAVNDTTEHWKLNFDAFAKLSEKTLENWLRAHKIAHLEEGAAPAWKHPWTLSPSLVKLRSWFFSRWTALQWQLPLQPCAPSSRPRGLLAENGGIFTCSRNTDQEPH